MKISELVKLLEEIKNNNGDLPVYLYSDNTGEDYEFEKGFIRKSVIDNEDVIVIF